MSQDTRGDRSRDGARTEQPPADRRDEPGVAPGAWMLSTVMQTVVAVVGLAVVLFALGRAVGVDLLGMTAQALTTQTGQWLAIAVVAFIGMGAAMRAMRYTRA